MQNIWTNGIFGLIVGDALGVPVEFTSRAERKLDPVVGMREYGTHQQPKGTWSDDSSMTLATVDSIKTRGTIDYDDIMDKFSSWCLYADYTPFNDVFDIGVATSRAIIKYGKVRDPLKSGGDTEWDNGNGSLMRILPVCLYLCGKQPNIGIPEDENISIIHNVSSLTHAHVRSQIACGIHYFIVKAIIGMNGELIDRLQSGMDSAYKYYCQDLKNCQELNIYQRLFNLHNFKNCSEDQIKSSGYVVDTLEAVIWCLISTTSYKSAVLTAVNLGDDTDTIGAITGGLAGLYYGYDNIPSEWCNEIQRKEWIDNLLSCL